MCVRSRAQMFSLLRSFGVRRITQLVRPTPSPACARLVSGSHVDRALAAKSARQAVGMARVAEIRRNGSWARADPAGHAGRVDWHVATPPDASSRVEACGHPSARPGRKLQMRMIGGACWSRKLWARDTRDVQGCCARLDVSLRFVVSSPWQQDEGDGACDSYALGRVCDGEAVDHEPYGTQYENSKLMNYDAGKAAGFAAGKYWGDIMIAKGG